MSDEHSDPYVELQDRLAKTTDEARADAVAKRHARGGRTARENLADLTDGGTVSEYGQLAVAAQRTRRAGDAQRGRRGVGAVAAAALEAVPAGGSVPLLMQCAASLELTLQGARRQLEASRLIASSTWLIPAAIVVRNKRAHC